jgi:hypothetical protein
VAAGEWMACVLWHSQRTVEKCPCLLGFLRLVLGTLRLDTDKGIFTFVKTIDPDARRAAVTLLRRGTITVSEAAALAGVSRQVVRYWCKSARIGIGATRAVMIGKAWRRAMIRSTS